MKLAFAITLAFLAIGQSQAQAASSAGCYHEDDHHCECGTATNVLTEASCEGDGLFWTAECHCKDGASSLSSHHIHGEGSDHTHHHGEGGPDGATNYQGHEHHSTGGGFTPSSKEQNAAIARWTLSAAKWGTLTTSSGGTLENSGHDASNPDESQPIFANVLPFASDDSTGRLFFYLMNERHLHSATLTVSQASINPDLFAIGGCGTSSQSVVDAEDPRCVKLSVSGAIHPCTAAHSVGEHCQEVGLEALYQKHPVMRNWPDDHHFTVHELVPSEDGFWMIANFGGGASVGGLTGYTNVTQDKVVPHDINRGSAAWVPPPQGDGFPPTMPTWNHRAGRARWTVHNSQWTTVSTLDESGDATFGNIRSVTDGTTLGMSNGLPVFYLPDVDPTVVYMNAHDMQIALSFSEAGVAGRVTSGGLTCAGQDAGMPTCAQVVMYGQAVMLAEESEEYMTALKNFKDAHPLASWLSAGGSHMSGSYYTIRPTRISILDFFGGAVDVDVANYLAVSFDDHNLKIYSSSSDTDMHVLIGVVVGLVLGCLCGCCGKSCWSFVVRGRSSERVAYDILTVPDGVMKPYNCFSDEGDTSGSSGGSSGDLEQDQKEMS